MMNADDPLRNPLAYVSGVVRSGAVGYRLIQLLRLDELSPTGLADASTGEPFTPPPEYAHLTPIEYLRLIGQ